MFEVFDYRSGNVIAYFRYESSARIFSNWLNKSRGGKTDYDIHKHEESREEATSPTPNGYIFVSVKCDCGATIRSYPDSIL